VVAAWHRARGGEPEDRFVNRILSLQEQFFAYQHERA
jgi:hypothetical protein